MKFFINSSNQLLFQEAKGLIMSFDIRTMLTAVHVIVWINFCIMILAWYNVKSMRRVIRCWVFGQALYGIGTLLLVLRGIVPDFLSVVITNACLVSAQLVAQEGISRYTSREGYLRKFTFSILALSMIFTLFFTYIMPSVPSRIVTYGLSVGLISAISIRTVWQKGEKLDLPRRFLVVVLGFSIAVLTLRAIFAILDGGYSDLMYSGFIQAVGVIGMLLAYVSFSIALFWLVVHKLGIEIQRQAMTDPLTNIGNRRALDELMEKQLPIKSCSSVGIMMIDVDRFKEINDQFGHQAGDYYLTEFVRVVKQEGYHLFRYAGDEFVVVAYNTDFATLLKKAECLKQKVEQMTISWLDQGCINTTVSIGIAMANPYSRDWDELMKRADRALYKVKNEGGNSAGAE
ncbi:MAG: putative rane associated signaling protein [Firmicutes bacterium]|nr:putative rane associated signaling protein [Bacillota bacterium]